MQITLARIGAVSSAGHSRFSYAQIGMFGTARLAIVAYAAAAPNGGSARGYQAIFVPSTAFGSPGYDGQPAVYLYIAALKVNVLNCRDE
jgi:hypothetical protein